MACVRCPWHGRRVCLESGRELQSVLTPSGRAAYELSYEPVQRTHAVTLADGYVWVTPAPHGDDALPSDRFNCTSHGGACPPSPAQQAAAAAPAPHALAPLPAQLLAAAAAQGDFGSPLRGGGGGGASSGGGAGLVRTRTPLTHALTHAHAYP